MRGGGGCRLLLGKGREEGGHEGGGKRGSVGGMGGMGIGELECGMERGEGGWGRVLEDGYGGLTAAVRGV